MRAALVSMVLALCLGIGAAYGQQPGFSQPAQLPGGTCSSYAADCNFNCDQLETPSPACHTTCANKLNVCVQSGMWHNGPDVTTNRQ